MRILISNDDGYQAPGLKALVDALHGLGDITVIAPERNASGTSNALTLTAPLSVYEGFNGYTVVNGTPSDCVHVALTGLLDQLPDLVVSGINNGANMGDDTIYSGTVAAATEGYLFGVPALAFSLIEKGWQHLDSAARVARDVVAQVLAQPPQQPAPWLLNVNIPNLPYEQLRGHRVTRLGKRHASEPVMRQRNPRGELVYWIGAAGGARDGGEGTDFHAVENGYVSITPLQMDLTDHPRLTAWREWSASAAAGGDPGAVGDAAR